MSAFLARCYSRGYSVQKLTRALTVCQYRNATRWPSERLPEPLSLQGAKQSFIWWNNPIVASSNIALNFSRSFNSSSQQSQKQERSGQEGSSENSGSDDDEEARRKANQKLFVIGLVSFPVLYFIVSSIIDRVLSSERRQEREQRYQQKDADIFGPSSQYNPQGAQGPALGQPSTSRGLLEDSRMRMGANNDPMIRSRQQNEVTWNEFYYQMLLAGEVQEIVIHSGLPLATIVLRPDAIFKGQRITNQRFRLKLSSQGDKATTGISDKNLEDKIRATEAKIGIPPGSGVSITYDRNPETIGAGISAVIAAALGLGVFFLVRKMGAAVGGMNPFKTMSKADFTLIDPKTKGATGRKLVKFSDVAGLKEPKIEVKEFVDYLKNPDKYKTLGAKPPKGALLTGPPGCGKTMLAKAIATESNVPFLSMNGSEFIEMIGGLGAARVRSLFAEARKRSPAIIYIDEIDAIGRKRSGGEGGGAGGGGGGEAEQTLNQLLVEMDGIISSTEGNVIMIASTNRADVLDKALLRPGRFDRHIAIDLPTVVERKEILEQHMKGVKLADTKDKFSERLATLTPGFSGADLANLVNEAALHAARVKKAKVESEDLEYAIERVIAGPEKKTSILNPAERRIVAYHESGHAIVGWMLQHTDALLKVTILPRTSQALGFAQYTPVDKKLYSPDELMDRMCMALGGRVAESLTFNRITTGAQNDLQKVTQMANAQIKQFGFNDVVGLVSFEEGGGKKPYSKRLHATMDLEARQLIAEAYAKTEDVLKEHSKALEIMAEALLEKETLNYDDVEALLGPPPFGKKHLVSPVDYENQLKKQGELGKETQSI